MLSYSVDNLSVLHFDWDAAFMKALQRFLCLCAKHSIVLGVCGRATVHQIQCIQQQRGKLNCLVKAADQWNWQPRAAGFLGVVDTAACCIGHVVWQTVDRGKPNSGWCFKTLETLDKSEEGSCESSDPMVLESVIHAEIEDLKTRAGSTTTCP